MKNLTWQNPEQLFVAQVLRNKVKSKCCGIKGKINNMKKSITSVILLCAVIIALAIINNSSFNKGMQSKKNAELSKDSLLRRQVETQDLLLRKASVLDTMNLEHKSNNSIIKEEIQKIRDNSDAIPSNPQPPS